MAVTATWLSLFSQQEHCCRMHQFADDTQGTQHSDATRDGAQQQRRMTDLLQLRSDELSAENAKLRMKLAQADKQLPAQLPAQLQHDYPFCHMSGQLQHGYSASHAALGLQQHASQTGGLSSATPLSTLGLPRAGQVSHTDRWAFLHCTCVGLSLYAPLHCRDQGSHLSALKAIP